jgi:hypothetical protein
MGVALSGVFRAWWLGCALATAAFVASRELHYLRDDWPAFLARGLDGSMHLAMHCVVILSVSARWQLGALGVTFLGVLCRRRWFLSSREGAWCSRPWLFAAAWSLVALNNFLLDVNPFLLRFSMVSLLIAFVVERWGLPVSARRAAVAACWLTAALMAATFADIVASGLWSLWLYFVTRGAGRISNRDRLLLGVAGTVLCQTAASLWPLVVPSHGGARIAEGMAYGFCENAERGRVYAAVPGSRSGREAFLDGRVDELDSETLRPVRRFFPFDPGFRGRLIAPLCLPGSLHLGMAETLIGRGIQRENVLEIPLDAPDHPRRSLFGGEMGQTLFRDEKRDAVFYASEWSNDIFRLDRGTGTVDRDVGSAFVPENQDHWFYFGRRYPGSLALSDGAHRRRDTFFAGHWLTGSTVYEIDLQSYGLRSRLEPRHGGTSALSLDEERGRLFVSSMWGLDVLDIESGRAVARIRTGLGCRTAVVDPVSDFVYLPTTIEGRIRVLDRNSLDVVGVIEIGFGPRNAFFAATSGSLLATSALAYYSWKSPSLRERFGRKASNIRGR